MRLILWVDLNEKAIHRAQKHLKTGTFKIAPAEQLPFSRPNF